MDQTGRYGVVAERIAAVVFDPDGTLLDSEQVWDHVREPLVRDRGGHYSAEAQRAMISMSSGEWWHYMHHTREVPQSPKAINDEAVRRLLDRYRRDLPLIDGAVAAVRRMAATFPLAVASSSNRPLIDAVLDLAGITSCFATTVSAEEVGRGKPAPEVYLEAMRRLNVVPGRCAAIEDSANGIRAAHAAGMRVFALPNSHFPPDGAALDLAEAILNSLDERTVDRVRSLGGE